MNNYFTYKTKQGLSVIFYKRRGFVKSFCGIGCKYGGANVNYKIGDESFKSPYGIAHFIEHKLFEMPDGSDAFAKFNLDNAVANAYTSSDKTIYYFTKNDSIFNSLKLLIEMYFTPSFKKEAIEKEKSIISSEINMYKDNSGYRITQYGINHAYPNDDYSYPIIGDDKSVKNTKIEDLYAAYNAFYTPSNSVLCIVGEYEEKELFEFIDNTLDNLNITDRPHAKKLPSICSKSCLKPTKLMEKVSQDEALIVLRNDNITNKDPISCEKILGILESILNISSDFYQSLYKKKYFENDIDYQVVTYLESSYVIINAPSKKPKAFAEAIINKLKELSIEDINPTLVNVYLKYLKSKSILKLDSIESLGDTLLSLALEDINYFESLDEIINLKLEDLYSLIDEIKNSNMTYVIIKSKKDE